MRLPRAATILILGLAMTIIGATAGGSIAAVTSRSEMGFDEIASALSGVMLGGLAGIIIALWMARKLAERRLRSATGVAAAIAVAIIAYATIQVKRDIVPAQPAAAPGAPTAIPR